MTIFHLLVAFAIVFLLAWSFFMSTALNRLMASVSTLTNVSASAITLITGLAQAVRDAADDPEQLNALADQLDADAANLANAITTNTPIVSAPGVQPDPTVPPVPAQPAADAGSSDEGEDTENGGNGSDTIDGTGAG